MDADETVVDEGAGAGTLVAEPKVKPDRKKREVPRYHVILWDSDGHSYEYVEKMLRELFGHSQEECRVIVLTTTREHAELKRDQIHAYGKDENIRGCKGSMHATVEPVG